MPILIGLALLGLFIAVTGKKTPASTVTADGAFVKHPADGQNPEWAAFTTAGKKMAFAALTGMSSAGVSGAAILTKPIQAGETNMNLTLQGALAAGGLSAWADSQLQQVVIAPQGVVLTFPYALLTSQGWPTPEMMS